MTRIYKHSRIIFLYSAFISFILGACAQELTRTHPVVSLAAPQATETRLATIPEGYEVGTIVFSPDGKKVVYSASRSGKEYIFFEGSRGTSYDKVKFLTLSHDKQRIAYVARSEGKEFIVVDGVEGKRYQAVDDPVFSPDSQTVAYAAEKRRKWYTILGDKESPGTDMLHMAPVFSADSRFVMSIEQNSTTGKSVRIVRSIDMEQIKKGIEYDWIGSVAISANKDRIVHSARRGNKWFIVESDFTSIKNGETDTPYSNISHVAISPDGKRIAYFAERGGDTFMVIADRETRFTADGVLFPPVFSPDGAKIAIGATRKGKSLIILDGKEGQLYDAVSPPVFSPDGTRLLYQAAKEGKWVTILADREGRLIREYPFDGVIRPPEFSPDGKSIMYGSRRGNELLLRNISLE
jgi:Tol biopolymer transport system component